MCDGSDQPALAGRAEVRAALRDDNALDGRSTARTWLARSPVDLNVLEIGAGLVIYVAVPSEGGAAMLDAGAQGTLNTSMQCLHLLCRERAGRAKGMEACPVECLI